MTKRDSTSFEGMVGRAIFGDDKEKNLQMIRIDCKLYASQKIFCECGGILDQKKIQILRDENEKVKAVCCQKCREKAEEKFQGVNVASGLRGWTWANWDWVTTVVAE
jgi:hypothetical protein